MAAGAGICLGLLTWGFAASVGLGALLSASRAAYNVLRVAGACYLVFLGCKMFFRSSLASDQHPDFAQADHSADVEDPGRWLVRGLLSNLLNPKVSAFYVTFLPLFIPAGVNVVGFSLLLAGIHVVEGFALVRCAHCRCAPPFPVAAECSRGEDIRSHHGSRLRWLRAEITVR